MDAIEAAVRIWARLRCLVLLQLGACWLLTPAQRAALAHSERAPVELVAFSGAYHKSAGEGGQTVVIQPEGRFLVSERGCAPPWWEAGGRVEVISGCLVLLPDRLGAGPPGFSWAYYPVRWGQRSYLVPVWSLGRFCDHVASGREPRPHAPGPWLLRQGDWDRPARGRPTLPSGVRHLLR